MARRSGSIVLAFLIAAPAVTVEPPVSLRPADRPPLTLSFVGDIMHHEQNAQTPDYDRIYDAVRPLLVVDDLSFANIEFPVDPSQPPAGYPIFNGTVAYVEAAVRAGFDVFALANNHTFDLGVRGVETTRDVFDDLAARADVRWNGIRPPGGGSIEPDAISIRGWRIGFVSVTAITNVGGAARHINLVRPSVAAEREAFVGAVRRWAGEYDLLVVAVHAGDEYVTTPSASKALFLEELAEAGARIVWSHHPHVLQPWALHHGALIMYSTGNFVSAQRRYQSPWVPHGRWAPTGDTAVYQVQVEWADAGPTIARVRTPFFTVVNHPSHGLVLRSFEEVLAEDLPLHWRAFYLSRWAALARAAGPAAPDPGSRIVSRR